MKGDEVTPGLAPGSAWLPGGKCAAALLLSGLACGFAQAHDWGVSPYPFDAPKPVPEDLRLAVNRDHRAPSNTQEECLGRLVFNTTPGFEWGIKSDQPYGTFRLKRGYYGRIGVGGSFTASTSFEGGRALPKLQRYPGKQAATVRSHSG